MPTFCRKTLCAGMFYRNRPILLTWKSDRTFFRNLLVSIYYTTLKIPQDVGSTSFRNVTIQYWTILSYNSEHSMALQIYMTLHHYDVKVLSGHTGLSRNPCYDRYYLTSTTGCLPYLLISYKKSVTE